MRNLLIRLPGTLGETVILPRVRYIYDSLPFLDYRTKRYAASEARRIRSVISRKDSEYSIVYDCHNSGLVYGSLLSMLVIGRYVIACGVFTNFYIVRPDSSLEDNSRNISQNEYLINDFVEISKALLDPKMSSVSLISSETLLELEKTSGTGKFLFQEYTMARRPFFRDCCNVFNDLMASIPTSTQDRILFSSKEFTNYLPKSFDKYPYVSWCCRYSDLDPGRTTTREEFEKCYDYLTQRFPDHSIVIVSDKSGCEYFSSLADDLLIENLLFSKEFSSDFLGDSALIMNSEFVFWFRAGGIDRIPRFSRIPYEMLGAVMNDNFWRKDKQLTSWQGKDQEFVVLAKHQFVTDRSLDLDKIGASFFSLEI